MLSIKNLDVVRGNNEVLRNLCCELDHTQIHGIVGLNGSGKTTLLETIFGFLNYKVGEINFNGASLINDNIAYLEAEPFFYPRVTGHDYLSIFKIKNPNFKIENWNKLLKLPLNDLVEHYSTGMKKKLAFMGVMSFNKPIIMLDEPFNSLDMETVEIIKNVLTELRAKGKTIIITSHILESLLNICDVIHYLDNGKFLKHYTNEEFDQMDGEIFEILRNKNKETIHNLV